MNCRKLRRPKNHDDWLQQRLTGLTGTDIAYICGESDWGSPLLVYSNKLGLIPPKEANEAMEIGTLLEDPIAKMWASRTGAKIKKINNVLQHEKWDWALANIDRHIISPEEGILEVKVAGPGTMRKWDDDQIPKEYYLQVMWYLMITGIKKAKVTALLGGNQLAERSVEYDRELADALFDIAHDFWHGHILTREPPPIDGGDATSGLLKDLFRDTESVTIDIPQAASWVSQLARAEEEVKRAQKVKDEAANNIKFLMGQAESALCGDCQLSWKTVEAKKFDQESFKRDFPELFEKYLVTNRYRRFMAPKEKK